jgi:hypothetical protein
MPSITLLSVAGLCSTVNNIVAGYVVLSLTSQDKKYQMSRLHHRGSAQEASPIFIYSVCNINMLTIETNGTV